MTPTEIFKTTLLLSLLLPMAQCSNDQSELICATATPKDEHTHQTVNCRFLDKQIYSEIHYQCTIYVDKELQSSNSQSVVQVEFSLLGSAKESKTANFFWNSQVKHHSESVESHSAEEEFKHNQTVDLSINSKNESTATVILYKLHYETVYTICVNMNDTFEQKVCCTVENLEEEEESNIYMVLVVLGVLLLIYAFVIIATKVTSKEEKSIDDLLETLPTAHVERLKSLFEVAEEEEDVSEYDSDGTAEEKSIDSLSLGKKLKSDKKVTIRDNFGYEPDADEEKRENYENEIDDIQLNLYKEAQKFRKLSRMSIAGFSTEDLTKLREKRTKNVKFDKNLPMVNEINKIKLKVYNESNRRASIKPYKRAYDLGASDSD